MPLSIVEMATNMCKLLTRKKAQVFVCTMASELTSVTRLLW